MTNLAEMARAIVDQSPDFDPAALTKRYPNATRDEFDQAVAAAAQELREKGRCLKAEGLALQGLAAFVADVEEGDSMGDKLRIKVARGSVKAQRILDSWNTREARVSEALFEAAASIHPAWRKDGKNWSYKGKTKPEDDPPAKLVDWVQRTHPLKARRIEDKSR